MRLSTIFLRTSKIVGKKSVENSVYYVVTNGRVPGIYKTWNGCSQQTDKFPNSIFKKFTSDKEAEEFFQASQIQKKSKTEKNIDLKDGFYLDNEGFIHVFTDGSCLGNGTENAKCGIGIFWSDDHPLNVSKAIFESRATNNIAEIYAIIESIQIARSNKINKLQVNTDSDYAINCCTTWVKSWENNNWRNSNGKKVSNLDLIQKLNKLIKNSDIIVKFNHIKGHSGFYQNEMADDLARNGALK